MFAYGDGRFPQCWPLTDQASHAVSIPPSMTTGTLQAGNVNSSTRSKLTGRILANLVFVFTALWKPGSVDLEAISACFSDPNPMVFQEFSATVYFDCLRWRFTWLSRRSDCVT